MDLSKPIAYRGVQINTLTETGRTLRGVVVENADFSSVDGVGYTEKRAATDGMHASDVYLGARYVDLNGFVYATDLADLFDQLHYMRSAFSPTAAYQESPGDRGFLPLTFTQPTKDSDFDEGVMNLQMLLRPTANLRFNLNRDRLSDKGLVDGVPGSGKTGVRAAVAAWASRLMAKDPRVYVQDEQEWPLSGTQTTTVTKTADNRGDYETPFNIHLIHNDAVAGKFNLTGLNDVEMEITLEAGKSGYTYRWFGDDRVLMTQSTPNAPLVLRMDLVKLGQANRKPMVGPGGRLYYYSHTANLKAGSRLFWSEAFA